MNRINYILKAEAQPTSSDCAWYNTVDKHLYIYNNGIWNAASDDIVKVLTTVELENKINTLKAGDIIYNEEDDTLYIKNNKGDLKILQYQSEYTINTLDDYINYRVEASLESKSSIYRMYSTIYLNDITFPEITRENYKEAYDYIIKNKAFFHNSMRTSINIIGRKRNKSTVYICPIVNYSNNYANNNFYVFYGYFDIKNLYFKFDYSLIHSVLTESGVTTSLSFLASISNVDIMSVNFKDYSGILKFLDNATYFIYAPPSVNNLSITGDFYANSSGIIASGSPGFSNWYYNGVYIDINLHLLNFFDSKYKGASYWVLYGDGLNTNYNSLSNVYYKIHAKYNSDVYNYEFPNNYSRYRFASIYLKHSNVSNLNIETSWDSNIPITESYQTLNFRCHPSCIIDDTSTINGITASSFFVKYNTPVSAVYKGIIKDDEVLKYNTYSSSRIEELIQPCLDNIAKITDLKNEDSTVNYETVGNTIILYNNPSIINIDNSKNIDIYPDIIMYTSSGNETVNFTREDTKKLILGTPQNGAKCKITLLQDLAKIEYYS